MTLRVYPGNVDFGASMYKTVVVTPATMSSEVAHQAVIKFRLAPDGTASTGDFYLTVKGVDGDETILQATDKPMSIYLSLTAHLTTPLPVNHRLSISSVSSMMSVNSTASQTSSTNNNNSSPSTALPGQRRSGSGKAEQPRSIRFLLNKKIRRASSITNSASASSLPATPTTPTTPQEDFFWVKVVCQAQDLPQSMLLLEGMGTAMDKADPRTQGQSVATKVEHWIPMHSTSNAGDVIFRTLESVGIRAGVVDGVQEHILVAKRTTVPNGLVIEYQLGLYLNSNTSKKHKQGEEIPLPPQTPLIRCFEEHQLVPVRRSPKADVASMPLHPDHVFFLRKAAKSLQAEMRFVQEQQQSQQQQSQAKKAPSPLLTPSFRAADSDGTLSAQPSPTHSLTGMLSPTSPGPQTRNFNPANAALMNASRLGGGNPAGSSPIRIPRRTDSVIMSPTSPLVRGDSFDHSSGRPSPTLSTQSLMTAQPIHPPQTSRTPTPDRHQFQQHQQQQQQQQQVRTRSPSVSQGSPTSLARPLQAPSPAPSNMSSHADQQEGSRSSTPERSYRPERQRATSPSLTHGPSPLSLSAVMAQSEQMGSSATRKASFASIDELLSPSTPSVRLNMRRNTTQGVDIVLNKGTVRSARTTSSPSQTAQYQYSFVPLEGGEEIDITEIIEDVLGGDSDDEHDDQQARRSRDDSQELETMSRRERIAAAVARASQAVAAGKERRRASASSGSISASFSVVSRSRRSISATSDRDRLEQLGSSARGGETLLKLERALAGENSAGATDGKQSSATGRNLPSPMSLLSSPSSPTLARKASDADVQIASVTAVGSAPGRNQSTVSVLAAAAAAASASAAAVGIIGSTGSSSPGPASPSSSSGYTRATLLSNINASAPSQKVAGSSPSSPSAMFASSPNSQYQQYPLEGRSYSPLPRPLQTPSPASSTRPNLLQLSIHTGASTVGVSSAGGPASASTVESNASPQFRSGNAGAGTGELQNSNIRNRSSSTSATEITRRGSTASSSTTTSSAPTSKVGGDGDLYAASASESKATTPTTGALQQNDPWLLSSDYNTGMQDLLTLVRGGRSSSVGTGAPSSLRGPGGITYGKDGRILPPPSSAPSSMNHPTRQRLLSLQPHNVPPPSSHSLYNTKNTGGTNNTSLNNVNNNKDTQAHDQHLDETHTNSNYSTTTNDKLHLTTRNNNIFNLATGNETIHEEDEESDEPMIWTRTERRLRDVQGECHPEVFECWKEVDAELDKVGRELDSLLATVKATIF
ncbi:hypothetical protein EDD21DRAFT_365539 [Dissophora ornata]|nr:hypothetical protein EDD21DRAFT_365539 [Dissophora ornata]